MVKHFTKENLGWTSMGKYPECSFKGSDTRLILHFLIAFLERPEVSLDAIATNGYVAAKAVHCVLRKIFSCKSALFKRCEAYEVLANLNLWSEKFRQCAQQCFDQQLCFFAFTPKYNFLLHVAADMHRQLDESSFQDEILNPSLFSTQMAEDYVGRSSRLGRSVHPTTCSQRTAQKWLVQTKLLWELSGKTVVFKGVKCIATLKQGCA